MLKRILNALESRWCPNCKANTPHTKIGDYWFMCNICGCQHA